MYFLWSEAHLAGKNGCVTQNVFLHYSRLLLACMIKQPHQRKYRGLVKSFFLWGCNFMVQSSDIENHPNFYPWSEKINPSDRITCGHTKWCVTKESGKCKESEDIFSFFSHIFYFVLLSPFILPPPPLLISGAGNRSHGNSDVTELSNSQLKAVQFTSSAARCKWPSSEHDRRRQTSC